MLFYTKRHFCYCHTAWLCAPELRNYNENSALASEYLVESFWGGASMNSTVDRRQSSKYIIGSLVIINHTQVGSMRIKVKAKIALLTWCLVWDSIYALLLSRRRERFALKNKIGCLCHKIRRTSYYLRNLDWRCLYKQPTCIISGASSWMWVVGDHSREPEDEMNFFVKVRVATSVIGSPSWIFCGSTRPLTLHAPETLSLNWTPKDSIITGRVFTLETP